MLSEFLDFCQELFPSIPYSVKDSAKRAFDSYERKYSALPFVTQPLDEGLAQGDIFEEMNFLYFAEDGSIRKPLLRGILLTNTCDNCRKDYLLFAALRPLSDFSKKQSSIDAIKQNKLFDFMYVDAPVIDASYVDFSTVSTYSRDLIQKGLNCGKLKRMYSLSQVGYYMFLCKLTIFLMRWEDRDFNAKRGKPNYC